MTVRNDAFAKTLQLGGQPWDLKNSGPGALLALDGGSAPTEEIEDQHYYSDDDQQVNQVAPDAAD